MREIGVGAQSGLGAPALLVGLILLGWGRELQLRAAMTSGSTLMRVTPVAPVKAYVGRRIMLEMPGALRFRTITSAITDGLDHRLTLSSNLGEPVPLGTKVHFLTAVRSDADRVEIQHGAVASEVTFPVVEVQP